MRQHWTIIDTNLHTSTIAYGAVVDCNARASRNSIPGIAFAMRLCWAIEYTVLCTTPITCCAVIDSRAAHSIAVQCIPIIALAVRLPWAVVDTVLHTSAVCCGAVVDSSACASTWRVAHIAGAMGQCWSVENTVLRTSAIACLTVVNGSAGAA